MTMVTYLGRRMLSDGKLAHAFAMTGDEDHLGLFSFKKGGWVIGGIYETVVAAMDEAGHITSLRAPDSWTGEYAGTEAERSAWLLADRGAAQRLAGRQAENRARRSSELDDVLAALDPVLATARSYTEAERMANTVKTELLERWRSASRFSPERKR